MASPINDDDLIIKINMGEPDPDGLADLYPSPFYQVIKADVSWVKDAVDKMAELYCEVVS
jgi:hypothetical protein